MVAASGERRNLEYKHPIPWNNGDNQLLIVKSILGMSNIAGGGQIIIGVEQKSGTVFEAVGANQAAYDSYVDDDIGRIVGNYADKHPSLDIEHCTDGKKRFIVITVKEFDETPVVCKKECKTTNGKKELLQGKMYTRSHKIPETIEVSTAEDLREIIELAIDKGVRKFVERATKAGLSVGPSPSTQIPSDKDLFDQELGGI